MSEFRPRYMWRRLSDWPRAKEIARRDYFEKVTITRVNKASCSPILSVLGALLSSLIGSE